MSGYLNSESILLLSLDVVDVFGNSGHGFQSGFQAGVAVVFRIEGSEELL